MVLIACLPSIHKALGLSPSAYKLGVVACACNPRNQEKQEGGGVRSSGSSLKVGGQPWVLESL